MLLKTRNEKTAVAGMLLALGILLPFATSHGLGIPGTASCVDAIINRTGGGTGSLKGKNGRT